MKPGLAIALLAAAGAVHAAGEPVGDPASAAAPAPAAEPAAAAAPPAAEPASAAGPVAAAEPAPVAAPPAGGVIELTTTRVTGNRELPKVLSIVPWKRALPAELGGRPARSLVQTVLEPLDRDEFRLQLSYYEQLHAASDEETE